MAAELVGNTTINIDGKAELQVSSDLWLVDSHATLQSAGILHFGGSFQLTNSAVEVSDSGSRIEGSVVDVSESTVSLTDSASLSVANLNLFSGRFTVSNGATAELTDGFILMGSWADDGPEPAELTIRGEGSQLKSVGQLLAGRLDSQNETHVVVASGGRLITGPGVSLTALSGVIAADPEMPAEALVTGLGSAWTQTGHLSVGHRGQGLLRVEDAGFVQSVDAFVGRQSSANGRVELDRKEGANSGPGGTWQVDRNLWIGGTDAEAGGVGQIDVGPGSTLNVGGRLHFWRGAAVSVHDGGRIGIGVTPEFQANAIVLTTGGTLSGTGQINGSIAATAGTIEPGDPLGTLAIDGSLELGEDVALLYQIGGTALNRVDRIDVTETIDFGGQLVVSLVDGFEPVAGDTFTLMTYGSRQGSFLDSQLPELPGSLNWLLDIGPTTLQLSVVPASTSGDVNLDGLVNRADVALIAAHFGQSNGSTLATGDLDGDSAITLKDLAILQRNLTSSGSPNAAMSSAAVPEPSGVCLIVIAVVSGMLRFRRHAGVRRLATLWAARG
jgi:T5SS/PEP-CTERM-associated repeat protein